MVIIMKITTMSVEIAEVIRTAHNENFTWKVLKLKLNCLVWLRNLFPFCILISSYYTGCVIQNPCFILFMQVVKKHQFGVNLLGVVFVHV